MKLLKKLDIFILRQFLLLFAGTFFICLFILLMQFIWRYVDELVGKGLTISVLSQFMFHASMTLVPTALPLAILLASLISFGNMGERLELLSMKASGIPLVRILRPVLLFVLVAMFGSFYFQNNISSAAYRRLYALLYSMKQKSPELEIPEGVFYSEIPGYNLFVEHKDIETGMLYGIMIYMQNTGYDDAQIVLADSGRIQTTAEQMHLKLTLYDGERFRNMQNTGSALDRASVPYMRETFKEEVDLIPFDNNFSVINDSLFREYAQTKNLKQLVRGVDSLRHRIDSLGKMHYNQFQYDVFRRDEATGRRDSAQMVANAAKAPPFDTLFARLRADEQSMAARNAVEKARSGERQTSYQRDYSDYQNRQLRIHELEWHRKFTLSLACLIFFFIGAPLGAIIRKGGLGVPVVVSVIIFIFYYMVNTGGEKLCKSGEWAVPFGAWLSTMVLAPISVWLTYKANQDSVVFNADAYRTFFRKLLGLRISRNLVMKEIIINDPDYERLIPKMRAFSADCQEYQTSRHLLLFPNYFNIFFRYEEDTTVIRLADQLEDLVDELHNARDKYIIATLNDMPILVPDAHTRPFRSLKWNRVCGIVFPVGLFFWLRIWRYRLRLWNDLEQLQKQFATIEARITKHIRPDLALQADTHISEQETDQ